LEMNLAFYSWYKRGEPFPVNDDASTSAVKRCLSILLSTIKEFTPRNHGNGWKLQKIHEILHLPIDIYMFGSPQNYDNSPTEHGLIETAKRPADHVQKSTSLFISQVTKCLLETTLIKKHINPFYIHEPNTMWRKRIQAFQTCRTRLLFI